MNNKQQKAIFNAFSQADQSITRLHGGTGLGLVISQRLAYEMNGDVGFSSQENNGSTFWFEFECGVNTLSLNNELEPLPLANKAILYYEPNSHSRAATYDILLNWEMQVTQVENISQLTKALENAKTTNSSFDYALIGHDRNATALSDLKKIITQIKSQITNIHLAINSNSPSLKDALLASGALSCLSKPITAYKLYTSLLADRENLLFKPNKKILPIKVLAVDDNEANLKLINALLLEQVSEVVLADNGMTAYELCKNESFDLIFMDIQMPIMDGISTLKAIKKDTCNSKTPVIAVTAHALSDEKEKMEQQGFNAYMTKPIDETMLNHIIYEYCDVDHFINFNKQQLSHTTKDTLPLKRVTQTPAIIDWSLAVQRTGGKEDLATEMLTGLLDSLDQIHVDINTALINKNSAELKNLIHKLNGACCYTGVPNLTTISQELETQLKNDIALDNLEPEFLELFEQIEKVSAIAPKFLAELKKKHISV
jgi:two-component system sensor histidine kinase BarA